MLLNGRQLINDINDDEPLILLSIENITVRKELEKSQKEFAQELELQVVEMYKRVKRSKYEFAIFE